MAESSFNQFEASSEQSGPFSSQVSSPIVFENDLFAIADKSHGMPTVPLKSQTPEGTLLGLVASECPDVLSVVGKNPWEHGAVHRLDTATGGLVIFAKTQAMYDHLLSIQTDDLFEKTYIADTVFSDRLRGLDPVFKADRTIIITSYFRSYGKGSKEVRPVKDIIRADSKVQYTTIVQKDDSVEGRFRSIITRGFRHQIRAHLAWIGRPIKGDAVYGKGKPGEILALECVSVRFPLPNGRLFSFSKEESADLI